nr:immunoglobulin light chain junction region [Macaca mulatta]MOW40329.1 immunoglobulin light chain junction region [Macaca mulatta]
CVQVLEFPFIF